VMKLDTAITIGDLTYTHIKWVRGEFDERVPYAELHPALVRITGEMVMLGRIRLTDAGVEVDYPQLLPMMRLDMRPGDTGEFANLMKQLFAEFMESLEQIAIGLQADPERNPFKPLKIALTEFPLSCTFEPIGERVIGDEIIDETTT
jgi:hypothetical protein